MKQCKKEFNRHVTHKLEVKQTKPESRELRDMATGGFKQEGKLDSDNY